MIRPYLWTADVLGISHCTCSYLDIYISQNIRICKGDFEGQFQTILQAKVSIFWSENADLLFSFSFYFLQNLSNPVLLSRCCCYSKELTWLNNSISNNSTGQFFDLKIQIYYSRFPFSFCRICQIHCFLHTDAAIPKSWHVGIVFWRKIKI